MKNNRNNMNYIAILRPLTSGKSGLERIQKKAPKSSPPSSSSMRLPEKKERSLVGEKDGRKGLESNFGIPG